MAFSDIELNILQTIANTMAIHPTIGKYISDQEDYVHRANITDNPLYITCGLFFNSLHHK